MLPNCQQIHEQFQNLLKSKGQFDEALEAWDLDSAKSIQVGMQARIESIGLAMDIPEFQFQRWAKEHGLEGKAERMEVVIGGTNIDDLWMNIMRSRIGTTVPVRHVLESGAVDISQKRERLSLVRIAVKHLGFSASADSHQIYERAQALGLALCPIEVGPQLRLQYRGDKEILVGARPLADRNGVWIVFRLMSDKDKMLLIDRWVGTNDVFDPNEEWVFVLPRKNNLGRPKRPSRRK
ncbi:hypothetical protein EPO05_05065 [Patescibacteria group bacterium]|nr:MAG: hypothetical protein EPO05_05065 [Patescibacteria group bacterium]